jgi:hypothetical protein
MGTRAGSCRKRHVLGHADAARRPLLAISEAKWNEQMGTAGMRLVSGVLVAGGLGPVRRILGDVVHA